MLVLLVLLVLLVPAEGRRSRSLPAPPMWEGPLVPGKLPQMARKSGHETWYDGSVLPAVEL